LLQGSALWIRSNLRPSLVTSRKLSNKLLAGTIYLCNSVKSLKLLLCINASLFERQTVTHCLRIESMHENIHNDFFLKNQCPRSMIICLKATNYEILSKFLSVADQVAFTPLIIDSDGF
jgi:hypothetical protein